MGGRIWATQRRNPRRVILSHLDLPAEFIIRRHRGMLRRDMPRQPQELSRENE